jgi:hypothetical protein
MISNRSKYDRRLQAPIISTAAHLKGGVQKKKKKCATQPRRSLRFGRTFIRLFLIEDSVNEKGGGVNSHCTRKGGGSWAGRNKSSASPLFPRVRKRRKDGCGGSAHAPTPQRVAPTRSQRVASRKVKKCRHSLFLEHGYFYFAQGSGVNVRGGGRGVKAAVRRQSTGGGGRHGKLLTPSPR